MKQIDGAFRRVRNDLNKLVKKTKASYYKKCLIKIIRIQKQRAWNIINKLINKQSKTTTVNGLIVNDKSITEPKPIFVNALNTYFSNIGSDMANSQSEGKLPPRKVMFFKQMKHYRFAKLRRQMFGK